MHVVLSCVMTIGTASRTAAQSACPCCFTCSLSGRNAAVTAAKQGSDPSSQMQVRDDSAKAGDGVVGIGDVMAFAFRMVRDDKTEYLDISYGLIVKISKSVPVKGGRRKEKSQTSISWDDQDATYLCRWYEAATTESGCPRKVSSRKAFVMPIHCPYGFNWEVHATDNMVLCPVEMEWNEEEKVFLLNVDSEKQATHLALESVTRDDGSREYDFVGNVPPDSTADEVDKDAVLVDEGAADSSKRRKRYSKMHNGPSSKGSKRGKLT